MHLVLLYMYLILSNLFGPLPCNNSWYSTPIITLYAIAHAQCAISMDGTEMEDGTRFATVSEEDIAILY